MGFASNKFNQKKFDVDLIPEIDTALSSKNDEKLYSVIKKLIFYDMRDIFSPIKEEGEKQSPDKLKKWHILITYFFHQLL